MDTRRKIGAVITAAGMSTRMGALKQTLPLGGKTIIEVVVTHFLNAGVDEIVVVSGFRSEEVCEALKGYPVTIVENADYATTQMFDSVKIGLNCIKDQCDRFFFTPVDVPAFKESTLLAELASDAPVVIPVSRGEKGHPILLDASLIPDILFYAGERGLEGALQSLSVESVFLDVEDKGALMDADTPKEYFEVRQYYENESIEDLKP